MAFDVIFARAVATELDGLLVGARAEKIYQPSKEEILLTLRVGRESKKLIISCVPNSARVCLTERQYENPSVPPMFCMLLRKYLSGAVIKSIDTVGFERAIDICFDGHDELGFACSFHIICEVMGKYSNIIFTDGEKKIISCTKAVDFTTSRLRQVLAGMTYEPPPAQDKACPLDETPRDFIEKFAAFPPEKNVERFFIETYTGFSPVVAREIAHRAGELGKCAWQCDVEMLSDKFFALMTDVRDGLFKPFIVTDEKGMPIEFSYTSITHIGRCDEVGSFSELLEKYYGEKAEAEALKNRIGSTETVVLTAQKRLIKKLSVLEEEIAECKDAEKYRLRGDLIISSLYKLQHKAKFAEVENYFADPVETVRIELDEKLTPAQNAAKFFKKYNKLKTAKVIAAEQIEKTKREIEYLSSVLALLPMCESDDDVSEIRAELSKTGYIRQQSAKGGIKVKKSEPMRFETSLGRELICGKNNTQNDALTLKNADKWDYWFHVKGGAGSHVIMKCAQDEDPDARDFTEAAQIAAYYSDERSSENVAVDYTRVKFVKKPAGSAPGHVIYTDYFTAYVRPSAELKRK